jgi:glucose/arabinose dehydrogenase
MKTLHVALALALAAPAAFAQSSQKTAAPKPAQPLPTTRAPTTHEPTPAPTTHAAEEMAPADVTRWLSFFDQLVAAVADNADSCDKMATQVSLVIDSNRSAIDLARDARAKGKKLPVAAQEHMIEGVRKMGPGIEKCSDNEKVKAAFAKLEPKEAASKEPTEKHAGK